MWMLPIAILIVLVAVLLVFAYVIPAARQRLEQRTQARPEERLAGSSPRQEECERS